MTEIKTQIYASYQSEDGRSEQKVASFSEALASALQQDVNYFSTYEVSTVTVEGRTFTEKPGNYSGRIFVGVTETKLHSQRLDELTQEIEEMKQQRLSIKFGFFAKKEKALAAKLDDKISAYTSSYDYLERDFSRNDMWIKQKSGAWIMMAAKDQAYDAEGRKIWPRDAAAPGAQPAVNA